MLKHEISHSIETTQAWSKMESLARQAMGEDAYAAAVRDMMAQRQTVGDTTGATETGAKKEVIADWVGKNLWKNNFAAIVAAKDKGLANKLALTMWNIRRGLSFTENGRQTARVKYAEQLLMKAIEDTARTDPALELNTPSDPSGGEYSVFYTVDNRAVAVIKNDIFEGKFDKLSESERVRITKNAIKGFRPGVPVSGRLIGITRKSAEHFANSDYTDKLRNHNQKVYEDKLNIAQNLDDVVYASTDYINEELKHPRDDNIVQFARGTVLLDIGGNKYEASVIVGYTTMKEMILYDVKDLVPTNFTIKEKKTQPTLAGNESYTSKTVVPSNTSVAEIPPGVKNYSMQNAPKNSSNGQLSFLPPEMMEQENGKPDIYQEEGERDAYLAEDRRDTSSVTADAVPPSPQGEGYDGAIDENGELDEDALNRMVEERKRTKAEAASLEANRALLAQFQNGEISEQTYLERVEDLRREAVRANDKQYRQGKRGSAEQKAAIKKLSNDVETRLEENYR